MQKVGEKKTEKYGTFEFFLEDEEEVKLICKNEDLKSEATYVGKIQGYNSMNIANMDIKQDGRVIQFISIPDCAYNAFQTAKSNFGMKNICLQYVGRSAETGIKWYSLSAEVPRETWKKIAKYFMKFDRDEEDALEGDLRGWLTAEAEAVEKILKVRKELTLEYRREQAKKEREEAEKKEKELQAKLNEIEQEFNSAEYPNPKTESPEEAAEFMEGYEKMSVEGEKIQHPKNPENIYGGGQWWIIQENWIWKINNNGHDGDNWSANNVNTGGAGAIGVRVQFSEDLAGKIRNLKT